MDWVKIFSLKSRLMFSLIAMALALFSVGAWWSVNLLVWSEVEGRLQANADRIESTIREKLTNPGITLTHLSSHFLGDPPSTGSFRRTIQAMDLIGRNPGLQYIGYAPIESHGSIVSAPVKLLEPVDWRRSKVHGSDLFSDPRRSEILKRALNSGDVVMARSNPLYLRSSENAASGISFFLPVETGNGASAKNAKKYSGFLYATFETRDFFESAFGFPSLKNEKVNFSLDIDGSNNGLVYNRFDLDKGGSRSGQSIRRNISVNGQNLVLSIYPLNQFFSFGDRYLALMVGLGSSLVSCMILLAMRVSQSQLDFEILAKEASMETAKENRKQADSLKKLNEIDRSLSGELDSFELLEKFSRVLSEMKDSNAFLLFSKESPLSSNLKLFSSRGFQRSDLASDVIPETWVEKVMTQSFCIRKGAMGSEDVIQRLLTGKDRFADWLLFIVSTREGGRCGLVFLARPSGSKFSEVEKEFFESIVTQFANSVEIAQLFSRVEDANRAKSAFLANMSHEIRTPLGAIIGFAEILSRGTLSGERKRSLSEGMRKNSEHLTSLIDDILDLSKAESGHLKIEKAKVSTVKFLQDLRSAMLQKTKEKGIHFALEVSGKIPDQIETDEIRLRQVLVNLIGNAVKFTHSGIVRIVVRHLTGQNGENLLAFTVKDTGIGISDEAQKDLFRPFSQGDFSSTRRFGGTGLGLTLSQRLAKELGGEVTLVESIRGQGSTFELKINAGSLAGAQWISSIFPGVSANEAIAVQPKLPLDGAKILLVEDSEDNQDIFRYFLESSGADAKIVTDGHRAVETAAKENFDLILMDIQIPGIDGKEATRRIRKQGFKSPIVALTAHAMVEEKESCIKAGCVGQITKPITGEALVDEVANYLRRA